MELFTGVKRELTRNDEAPQRTEIARRKNSISGPWGSLGL